MSSSPTLRQQCVTQYDTQPLYPIVAHGRFAKRIQLRAQTLETDKTELEGKFRALQSEMTRLGERRGGQDGQDGSEALQKKLMGVLTDLAQASTEVMWQQVVCHHHTGRCG